MNGKPDYLVRALLVLVVLLLAVQIGSQFFQQSGRYALARIDASGVAVLDTRTGVLYVFGYETKKTVKLNLIEDSKRK